MKNKLHFKAKSIDEGYQKVVTWINNFNTNLSPKEKIRTWKVHYKANYVTLNF